MTSEHTLRDDEHRLGGPGEYGHPVGLDSISFTDRMEHVMSKRTSKRATRRKKSANHGKRPNGS